MQLRHILSVCFIFFLLASGAARGEGEKHFLWKVKSGDATMFLLGSVHVLRNDDYPLAGVIESAYTDSDALIVEVDTSTMNPLAIQQLSLERGMLHDGETLADYMSRDSFRKINALAEDLGYDMRLLSGLEPWLAAMTVIGVEAQKAGFNPANGVDMYFIGRAAEDGKEIQGLETAEYQISIFDGFSRATQEQFLLQSLEQAKSMTSDLDKLVRIWRSGDTDALAMEMQEDYDNYPEVYDKLLAERNRNWLPVILKHLQQPQTTMVVVGALHLVGKDGIIKMLRDRGFSVTQQ
ncbi:MAG: TraB/GumN family protein [Gammaproteobacteria bacterium]|nr:TraB/GumN family protein [Gammaproteobacteria bacterium]